MSGFEMLLGLLGLLGVVTLVAILRSIRIVPAQTALVVERLGKFHKTLEAGFHILVPFIDQVRYRHSLKEQAVDVPSQTSITSDNVKVEVDGVLYMRVVDPKKASYGIKDYKYGTIQLAQTTMRSVMGKLELDRTFEERTQINGAIVKSVDEASDPWGVRVTRYEVQNIRVPDSVLTSMEVQMIAERERRAAIARSQGEMESRINRSVGVMEEAINRSEGEKERHINEAEGARAEILALAQATSTGLRTVADAISSSGGEDAVLLRLAEQYISQLQNLARGENDLVLPVDLTDVNGVIAQLRKLLSGVEEGTEE
jgi:regulator of protease activity HflC (stomatin/prohibitin superfamily)